MSTTATTLVDHSLPPSLPSLQLGAGFVRVSRGRRPQVRRQRQGRGLRAQVLKGGHGRGVLTPGQARDVLHVRIMRQQQGAIAGEGGCLLGGCSVPLKGHTGGGDSCIHVRGLRPCNSCNYMSFPSLTISPTGRRAGIGCVSPSACPTSQPYPAIPPRRKDGKRLHSACRLPQLTSPAPPQEEWKPATYCLPPGQGRAVPDSGPAQVGRRVGATEGATEGVWAFGRPA